MKKIFLTPLQRHLKKKCFSESLSLACVLIHKDDHKGRLKGLSNNFILMYHLKHVSSLPAEFLLVPSAPFPNKFVALHHPSCTYCKQTGCKHPNALPLFLQMGARWVLFWSPIPDTILLQWVTGWWLESWWWADWCKRALCLELHKQETKKGIGGNFELVRFVQERSCHGITLQQGMLTGLRWKRKPAATFSPTFIFVEK